ncbi:unnamed protein product [Arabis nemorensis]|uniref:RING-type domain-containing protein n=1 Tax=Arabis nemorensis TaxID=586526 RepID=A0A565C4Y0_9BRAS|nr:unnamed protein product [Arabis nemorensis]
MVMGSESNNVDKCKQVAYEVNVNSPDDNGNETASNCSICLEPLVDKDENRTPVTLRCCHQFHLDCIGSAFNAKSTMQCPNCRTIEPGQWRVPIVHPTPDLNPIVGLPAEQLAVLLGFGMELMCPFGYLDHLNPTRGPTLCPYFDYSLTIPQYLLLARFAEIPNLTSHLTTGSGVVHNPNGLPMDLSNPSFWLTPLSPLPTNPRYFRSNFNPEVIIARHYFTHPNFDYSLVSAVNASVVPPNLRDSSVATGSLAPPYLGDSSIATVSLAPLDQPSSSLANAPVVLPYLSGSSAANVPAVLPSQGGSGGDNDRGGGSGGIHENHDCGPS